ncbi:MAG TPA: hypothetical protein ENJ07_00195 [Gammaproteobacteria bacterium]|nr:hypothetical protein [Gammaproteobacteria bacterium]
MLSQKINSESIARKTKGFSVIASPLNPVKLELIVVFIVGGLFWLLLIGLDINDFLQVVLLWFYGIASMVWIIFRTKQISGKAFKTQNNYDDESS